MKELCFIASCSSVHVTNLCSEKNASRKSSHSLYQDNDIGKLSFPIPLLFLLVLFLYIHWFVSLVQSCHNILGDVIRLVGIQQVIPCL